MNPTQKVIELVDKLKLQQLFVEKNNRVYFTPLRINPSKLEKRINNFLSVKGRAYKKNDLEESLLRDLDF